VTAPRRATPASDGLRRLLRDARQAGIGTVDPAHDRAEKERMLAALAHRAAFGERARARSARWWVVAGVALAAAAALVLWLRATAPLSVAVEGAALAEGGWLSATTGAAGVHFGDGTRVVFAEGAQGRLVDVDPRGARLVLEGGRLHLDVVPGRGGRWSVQAGPFVVDVTGTVFDVEWSAGVRLLVLRMEHGSVRVRGPLAEGGIDVVAGQELRADLSRQEIAVSAASQPSAAADAVRREPSPAAALPEVAPAAQPAPAGAPAPAASGAASGPRTAAAAPAVDAPSWSARVASGDFAGVLAEAQARGVDVVLAGSPLADLVALADAARYAGSADVARRALQAQRARFAGSGAARAAAFLLGRLAEDRGASAEALSFYDVYLAESPQGAFAAEALGRKMVAVHRGGGQVAATLADEYLRRFPTGPYAGAAREISGAPR
jgi:hypothetical protein